MCKISIRHATSSHDGHTGSDTTQTTQAHNAGRSGKVTRKKRRSLAGGEATAGIIPLNRKEERLHMVKTKMTLF